MTVSPIGTPTSLATTLQAGGMSARKIAVVAEDLRVAGAVRGSDGTALSRSAASAVLSARINQDVQSGILSEKDAAVVRTALDKFGDDALKPADTKPDDAVEGDDETEGGGQSVGGKSQKTELFRTVLDAGQAEITMIVYTDGTNATETRMRSVNAKDGVGGSGGGAYRSQVDRGMFLDEVA